MNAVQITLSIMVYIAVAFIVSVVAYHKTQSKEEAIGIGFFWALVIPAIVIGYLNIYLFEGLGKIISYVSNKIFKE